MKKTSGLVLSILLFNLVFAQHPERCGTMEMDTQRRVEHSLESLDDFENWMQAKLAIYVNSPRYHSGQRSVVTIPIIFHIINNGENVGVGTNLSQAQINSQIAVLNEDYRKAFGTKGYNTNAVGADCEIEFCAAVIDPSGNVLAEPGIDRRNMGQSTWSETTTDATVKPQTIWDPTLYFNVWTVNFGNTSTILGYAQLPSSSGLGGLNANGGASNTDGVVIRYNATGRVGNLDPTYNLGRTLTHESGHFFGLRHIWGDQNCGNDYCNDTPTSSAANYGCPTGLNTCTAPLDMIDNYMDYTDDACMDIFTQNQKDRMWVVLNNSPRRISLVSSNVCTIPFTFSYTGRVVDASNNQGIANAKVFFDGHTDYTPVTDVNGYFTIDNLQQDNYTVYAGKWGYVTKAISAQLYSPATPQIVVALQPGYYDDALLDFGWTVTGNATTGIWTRAIPVGTSYTANGVTNACNPGSDVTGDNGGLCFVTGNGGGNAGDDDVDGGTTTITTPGMDLSTYTDPVIRYYRWFFNSGGSGTPNDSLVVSIVNGSQIIDIDKVGQGANSNQWIYRSIRIKNYIASPGNNIKVQFRTSDLSSSPHLVEAGVDLFRVIDSTATTSQPPTAAFGSNITSVCAGGTVSYNDLSTNNPDSWAWLFPGGSPPQSTASNPSVIYPTPGIYAATLTVTNGNGSNAVTQSSYVTVKPVVPQFTQDHTGICPGQSVIFSNGSSCNPTSISWRFRGGDPETSTDQNPEVAYLQSGYYDVVLIAGNQYGTDSVVQNLAVQVYSTAGLSTVAISDTDAIGLGTATVTTHGGFGPFTYSWNDSQHQTTPTATNLHAGNYNVSVVDGHGCSSITSIKVLNVGLSDIGDLSNSFVKVYPNPARKEDMFLDVSPNWLGGKAELINTLGQSILKLDITTSKTRVPFSDCSAGIYMLRLSNGNHASVIKVVKEQ